jgi:hypothetical protein
MANPVFLQSQRAGVRSDRVARVNGFIDELRREHPRQGIPYVPPHYDASSARILILSSNPGPKATESQGSGFLSRHNRDFSALRMSEVFESVGLEDDYALPWNVCPWDVHLQVRADGTLPTELILEGLGPLRHLFEISPSLTAVIAHGTDAKRAMKLFSSVQHHGHFAESRGLQVFETRHTSPRWFNSIGPERREVEMRTMRQIYRDAMTAVGLVPLPEGPAAEPDLDTPFPPDMFGFVPYWLPTLIGKVVMVAALVEGKVDALLMNLSGRLQNTYAGKPVNGNIELCRTRLRGLGSQHEAFAVKTLELLDDVDAALKRRNAVVHSLWPDNTLEVARGWRNLPLVQRAQAMPGSEAVWTAWVEMDRERFDELVALLVQLVDRLVDAIATAGSISVAPSD